MKSKSLFAITALCAICFLAACKNDNSANQGTTLMSEEALSKDGAPAAPPSANPATPEPPQNAAGIWHYTCPKGCVGGAGSASPCASCGATLVHNQAYHGVQGPADAPGQAPATPGGKKPEPPQNAAGVWHYTCPKGCEGGAGSSILCAKCGKQLEHNKVYHQ